MIETACRELQEAPDDGGLVAIEWIGKIARQMQYLGAAIACPGERVDRPFMRGVRLCAQADAAWL